MFLRLRQLCLVAHRLEPVVDTLSAVFGVEVCYRDPVVAQFGLHNALLPFGTSFIEVVAPLVEGTAAARYLERRHGDGGYMVILDSDELPRWRRHAADVGVRIAAELTVGDYEGIQLHPRDTGGALLEINYTKGGHDIDGPYGPAGRDWPTVKRRGPAHQIAGIAVQSADPRPLARRWADILQRPITAVDGEFHVPVDNAVLRFVAATDGRGEGLAGIDLFVVDADAVRRRAAAHQCPASDAGIVIAGMHFALRRLPGGAGAPVAERRRTAA